LRSFSRNSFSRNSFSARVTTLSLARVASFFLVADSSCREPEPKPPLLPPPKSPPLQLATEGDVAAPPS
jgi:hypothetical protein